MGDFDKILKENIEAVFLPMAEEILGISIKETFPMPKASSQGVLWTFGEGMPSGRTEKICTKGIPLGEFRYVRL